MFDTLNVAERLNLIDVCFNMILNGHTYSKKQWSKLVWERVWHLEDEEYMISKNQLKKENLLFQVLEKPYYLTRWVVG